MTYFFSNPRNILILLSFLIFLLLNACGGGAATGTSSNSGERSAYQQALSEYNNNNYSLAFNLFNSQLGSYPTGKYADNAHYYEGRILYSNGDYFAAQSQFDIVLQQFTNSNYTDSARYWLAKTWHARGQFDTAIIEYSKVDTAGKWGDNAAYQLGKIDYDKAKFATTRVQAYKNYSDAILKLRTMIDNAAYVGSSSLDDAGYYLGRCYQETGNLLLRNSLLTTTTPQKTAQDQYVLSKNEFNKIENTSVYFDDANYQLIRITFEQAKTHVDPLRSYLLYEKAITDFDAFLNNANFTTGNRIDDADYYLGRSFQEQGYLLLKNANFSQQATLSTVCLTADACFLQARNYYAVVPVTSVYSDDAQYYGARSYHESGNYVMARTQYQLLIDAAVSSWADDAQYQKGKTYYDNGKASSDPVIAMQQFTLAITEFDNLPVLFSVSNRLDSNLYFKGRSVQRQALLAQADNKLLDTVPPLDPVSLSILVDQRFIDARNVYQQLIINDPGSNWSDNAMNRQAESHYEEASFAITVGDLAHDITAQNSLSQAIKLWSALLVNSLYRNSNSADNAQYSLGRSYQLAIKIPLVNLQVSSTGGVDFTNPALNSRAIIEFQKLIANIQYQQDNSPWMDHAYYNIGVIYHQEALVAITNSEIQTDFDLALINFNSVVTKYNSLSLFDNAATNIALVYHDAGVGYCTEEINWFTYVQSKSLDPVLKSDATNHLAELQAVSVALNHDCVTMQPVLTINNKITAPLL